MRKKILAAVLAATMPEVIGVKEKDLSKKETRKTDIKVENNKEEIAIEEIKEIEETDEVFALESTMLENSTKKTIIENINIDSKNMYTYEFEGKYWLRYSEYGHKGLYFDGTQVISKMEDGGTFCRDYSVEGNVIYIGEPFYRYEIKDGKLGLAFVRDNMGGFSYYEEVEKAEYDSIFI